MQSCNLKTFTIRVHENGTRLSAGFAEYLSGLAEKDGSEVRLVVSVEPST